MASRSKEWDWIDDDDIADVLRTGATLIGLGQQRAESKNQEAWAHFNKQADAMQLAQYIDRQKQEADFDRRTAALHDREASALRFEVDILKSERTAQREKLSIHDAFADTETRLAWEQRYHTLGAAIRDLDTRAGTLGARRQIVDLKAATSGALARARRGTLVASRRELDVEARAEGALLAGRAGLVATGLAAVDAERSELMATTATRLRQRTRAFAEEVGAAEVGAAARGVTGSMEGVARAVAGQRLREDVGVLEAQVRTQEAMLGRRGAELELDASRIGADRALGAAARAVRGARLGETGIAIGAEERMARIEAGVARQELRGEADVLGMRREAAEAQQLGVTTARDRTLRENKLRRVGLGVEGARMGLAERRAGTAADRAALSADRARGEARTADVSAFFAQWSLDHVPELPDYEGARFRSSVGALLGLGASMIDDDE